MWIKYRRKEIQYLSKKNADSCWHNSGTFGTREGSTRVGGSFLCGADLQSGSSTGPPFNQRYSNCIVWPLWRALLNDVARPLRLQHYEDIIDGSVPLDVWDSQGNYKHKCLIIDLLFSLQQQQHKCNTQGCVYTETREIGKEESKFVFISSFNQAVRGMWFPHISLPLLIHTQHTGAVQG